MNYKNCQFFFLLFFIFIDDQTFCSLHKLEMLTMHFNRGMLVINGIFLWKQGKNQNNERIITSEGKTRTKLSTK